MNVNLDIKKLTIFCLLNNQILIKQARPKDLSELKHVYLSMSRKGAKRQT